MLVFFVCRFCLLVLCHESHYIRMYKLIICLKNKFPHERLCKVKLPFHCTVMPVTKYFGALKYRFPPKCRQYLLNYNTSTLKFYPKFSLIFKFVFKVNK